MSNDHASRVARQLAAITTTDTKLGILVGRVGKQVAVNVGETTPVLPFTGNQLPPAGHAVVLLTVNGQMQVTGPGSPLPPRGTVTAVGDPLITVAAYETTYDLLAQPSYLAQVGDEVEITWSIDGGLIRGEIASPEIVQPPIENGGSGGGSFHPAPFQATDSGSFDSKWSTNAVYSSASKDGAWFYSSGISDTIPDGAVITMARIYLPVQTLYVGAPGNLTVHTSATKPGGNVAWTGLVHQINPGSGWHDIPLSFIDFLKSNAGGIGFNQGGYCVYRGTGSDALSGALDIAWTT